MLIGMFATNKVLMIRPANFGFNTETAESNTFQVRAEIADLAAKTQAEFDGAVEELRAAGVKVEVVEDTPSPIKPDAVFPNNWVSFHPGNQAILYPMATPNRRAEVRPEIVEKLGYKVILDLSGSDRACEGTGSLVFDHHAKFAYACLSPRTDEAHAREVCDLLGYDLVLYEAFSNDAPIYHTNVVMAVGEELVVLCAEACIDPSPVVQAIRTSEKELLTISASQMNSFAGNMLQLRTAAKEPLWVMSETAWRALDRPQQMQISQTGRPVPLDISTIETIGGGSARCMIAELF